MKNYHRSSFLFTELEQLLEVKNIFDWNTTNSFGLTPNKLEISIVYYWDSQVKKRFLKNDSFSDDIVCFQDANST